jgi:hypothetical protein
MLERIARGLIESLAPLALEELQTVAWAGFEHQLIHVPVIATTATLHLGSFDPGSVDLARGVADAPTFVTVPFVRFRKSLAHTLTPNGTIVDISAIARDKERSVVVVNAAALPKLLKQFTLEPYNGWYNAPWEQARQTEDRLRG